MAVRFPKPTSRQKTYIKAWREHRHLTQDQLAERLSTTKATLSRIENGKIPYSQDFLEACAAQLNCDPADLIMRDPTAPDAIWSIWEQASKAEKEQIVNISRALLKKAG